MTADPFLSMVRSAIRASPAFGKRVAVVGHAERAHSKFSASGAERWFNCPGSVELSEGQPDKSSIWAEEGTRAHEILEEVMKAAISVGGTRVSHVKFGPSIPREMQAHALHAANFILGLHGRTPDSEVMIETRIYLDFIHPEMFGTFDGAVIEHFGTLHVFDYKYGAGHMVTPKENLQMVFYAIGLAYRYHWNFKRVRVWIIQPRVKGYDGPLFWEITIAELKAYVVRFRDAVKRVEREPENYIEGSWCHWCKAKSVCPLKQEKKVDKAISVFSRANIKKVMALDQEELTE